MYTKMERLQIQDYSTGEQKVSNGPFSFIVNFAAETQRAELKEAILLLDEPARNLHPTQQMGISDLLKNLAGSNQVLYATHSPFHDI